MNCFGARLRENICVKGDCLFHPADPVHFSLFISTLIRAYPPKFQQFLSLQNNRNCSQFFSYFMKPLHPKALTTTPAILANLAYFLQFYNKDLVISAVHV